MKQKIKKNKIKPPHTYQRFTINVCSLIVEIVA